MAFEITTHSKKITPTIVFDTAAYAAGDCMGGKITLTNAVRKNGGQAILTDVTVINNDGTRPNFNIIIFSQDPTAATLTDNATIDLKTDIQYVQAVIPVYAIDYDAVGVSQTAGTIQMGNVVLKESSGTSKNLYMALMATLTNDLTAATDLRIKLGVLQD